MPKLDLDIIEKKVNQKALIERSLTDWRPILAVECGCYVFGEQYLCKRFDQINYTFSEVNGAREVVVDNLYALLRYKYFPISDDEVEKRIGEIIKSFTVNLKTTLIKVSFDTDKEFQNVMLLENSQVAFRNGVFDFRTNDWLFKYTITDMPTLFNRIYSYDTRYIIQWYFNFNFEPLPFAVTDLSLEDFTDFMRTISEEEKNYCFQLLYNMSFNNADRFDKNRFKHACEILGYTILQTFSQNFVLLIGSGQNGKNSLFDGRFTGQILPRPAANDMDSLESDKFITGSLENKSHNIFLETLAKTYVESKMIKALTGSMYQTIESKGIQKYSGVINCKYVFAGNDQEKIKFSDSTTGFRRRINIFEIYYRWDAQKKFMNRGDYYDTTFSDDLKELSGDIKNTIMYIYFGMYGILSGTNNFTENFAFTENDWKLHYTDMDFDLREMIENVTPEKIIDYMNSNQTNREEARVMFFDCDKKQLTNNQSFKEATNVHNSEDLIKFLEDDDSFIDYFSENDVYISIRAIQGIVYLTCPEKNMSPNNFTNSIKKIYSGATIDSMNKNRPYIKCTFVNKKLKIIGI